MLYGLESASMRKRQEAERQVAQLKMLMFSLGEKRMDRISSEYVRGTARVICLGDKVRQVRLRWFGHVHRRDDDCIGRRTLRLELKESPKMPHNPMFSRKVLFSFGHIWDILFQLFFIRLHTDITWTNRRSFQGQHAEHIRKCWRWRGRLSFHFTSTVGRSWNSEHRASTGVWQWCYLTQPSTFRAKGLSTLCLHCESQRQYIYVHAWT